MEFCPECGHLLPNHNPECKYNVQDSEIPEPEVPPKQQNEEDPERWDGLN